MLPTPHDLSLVLLAIDLSTAAGRVIDPVEMTKAVLRLDQPLVYDGMVAEFGTPGSQPVP